eukprot:TRINITY_DN2129_c0_g1_i2.p1 TRINITY_DN2129_c0_g1~~TRINITY_DN2129_c0_g1_i2.p1  ORF type:complete len:551 (+),score=200.35 TRINITY_DN2129_c0_g1_i2:48-1655(+)
MSKHHFSDTERKSFVDYLNKTLASESLDVGVLPLPIDPDSPTELFQVASQGVLMCKFINKCFPNTINEKTIVTKPEKNIFETNINNGLSIIGAKALGCSVVNIGPDDLSAGTPTLVLGLLWQIIKKALLKDVNMQDNPELAEMFQSEAEASAAMNTMTPEQVLQQWVNYHLKKANKGDRAVKNFAGDIQDCESYAILLRQIAHKDVSEEDINQIMNESDLHKRAEKLIECAKRIIDPSQSIFVTPEDIVNGNPRLNLAFAATLFHSHPALGPSEEELQAIESQKASLLAQAEGLTKEKQDLQSALEKQVEAKAVLVKQLEESQIKMEETKKELVEVKEILEKQAQQWVNHHLQNAKKGDRAVKNFAEDVQNSENYAILLRQIASTEVTDEDVDKILAESDPQKRAEQLIECAKRIIGPSQSISVTPEDIVKGNAHANLAFASALFQSRPALGPSQEEQHAAETEKAALQSQTEVLTREKQELQVTLEAEKEEKANVAKQLEQSLTEVEEKKEGNRRSERHQRKTCAAERRRTRSD